MLCPLSFNEKTNASTTVLWFFPTGGDERHQGGSHGQRPMDFGACARWPPPWIRYMRATRYWRPWFIE